MPVPPFPLPDPDDPDGGPEPGPDWGGLTARPMSDGRPVRCSRALTRDPHGMRENYCGGAMRARPGLDDDAEPPSFFRRTGDG